jgi:hypothetical protein
MWSCGRGRHSLPSLMAATAERIFQATDKIKSLVVRRAKGQRVSSETALETEELKRQLKVRLQNGHQ